MSFFTNLEPTEHTITDPDTGETATVQIKKLSAGDLASIHDSIRMNLGDKGEARPDINLGAFRMLIVEKSLVSWSLEQPVTPNTIRLLSPAVFEQIFDICNEDEDEKKDVKPSSTTKRTK